jgi:hypothetical protein
MRTPLLAIEVFVLALLVGCDPYKNPTPTNMQTPKYQRFLPVPAATPVPGTMALDTKTGQLCRTVSVKFDTKVWDDTPECIDLFRNYPD